MDVVAFGPPASLPTVPDSLVVKDPHGALILIRAGSDLRPEITDLSAAVDGGSFSRVGPFPYLPGSWLGVTASGPEWFLPAEEGRWRVEKASIMLKQAEALRADPVRGMEVLREAAAMVKVSIPDLVSGLEAARRDPKESLADILLRVKSGQTQQDSPRQ